MTSPIALSRTTSTLSNRGMLANSDAETVIRAASRFAQPRADDLRRRMILRIAHDHYPSPAGLNFSALRNALRRVVRTLRMKVGSYLADNRAHIPLCKHDDRIHIRQRRQNFRPLVRR